MIYMYTKKLTSVLVNSFYLCIYINMYAKYDVFF